MNGDLEKKKRYNNFDLLRCICLVGVFALHMQRDSIFHQYMACLGTMSVSLFIMMSGAFTMTNSKETDLAVWFKKTCHKLVMPWILVILLYFAEGLAFQYLYTGDIDVMIEFSSFLDNGYPVRGWHLWYMYVLIEIYFLAPFLKWIKRKNLKMYYFVGVLIWMISQPISLPWYFIFVKYIGLYIAGDFIFSYGVHLKRRGQLIAAGVMATGIAGILTVNAKGITLAEAELFTVVTEISVMLVFVNLHINLRLYPITRYFMAIYFLHIFVGDFWAGIERGLRIDTINAWWMLLVDCSIVFLGCYFWCIVGGFFRKTYTAKLTKANI